MEPGPRPSASAGSLASRSPLLRLASLTAPSMLLSLSSLQLGRPAWSLPQPSPSWFFAGHAPLHGRPGLFPMVADPMPSSPHVRTPKATVSTPLPMATSPSLLLFLPQQHPSLSLCEQQHAGAAEQSNVHDARHVFDGRIDQSSSSFFIRDTASFCTTMRLCSYLGVLFLGVAYKKLIMCIFMCGCVERIPDVG